MSKFSFVNCKQIGNLLVFDMRKEEVILDKPCYIGNSKLKIIFFCKCIVLGAAVLNLAKVIMYDFHYNFIMKKFPTAKLLFTDTDSLCYLIETEKNLYDEIKVRLIFFWLPKLKLSFRIHNIWISLIIDLIMLTTIKINILFQGTSRMNMVSFFHLIITFIFNLI